MPIPLLAVIQDFRKRFNLFVPVHDWFLQCPEPEVEHASWVKNNDLLEGDALVEELRRLSQVTTLEEPLE